MSDHALLWFLAAVLGGYLLGLFLMGPFWHWWRGVRRDWRERRLPWQKNADRLPRRMR